MSAPSRPPTISGGLDEGALWRVASRTVLFTLGLLLLGWLLVELRAVVVQVLLAIILAAGMAPLVDRLTEPDPLRKHWRPPRALVVLLLYLLLVLILLLLGSLVLPPLFRELEDLARRLPIYADSIQSWLLSLPERYPFLPAVDVTATLGQQLETLASQLIGLLSQAIVVVQVALGIVGGAFNAVFTLILALYMTADSRRIMRYLISFLPVDRHAQAERVVWRIGQRLGGWVRGQLLLSAIIGLLTLIGLSVIGVRYAVLLALIAAVGEAIPMVGPIISAVPAVVIAFIYSPVQGLLTLGLYVLVQQLENHLIVPRVMSRAVSLHPLAVLLALLAGGELMGIAGAILAVPITAALAVIVDEIRHERRDQPSLGS